MTNPEDVVHKAYIPFDSPVRSMCGEPGPMMMLPEAVTCPDCVATMEERADRIAAEVSATRPVEPEIHDAHAVDDDESTHPTPGEGLLPGDLIDNDGDRWVLLMGGDYAVIGDQDTQTRAEIDQRYGIQREGAPFRIVPADAIVLDPTTLPRPAWMTVSDGMVNVIHPAPTHMAFFPGDAREFAALIALAADDAERGQQ